MHFRVLYEIGYARLFIVESVGLRSKVNLVEEISFYSFYFRLKDSAG
jgi:hypothetical protein